ncbi:MAG: DNA-processing protein DprA [Clostridia bacterium]|nr:DNA-processing protein DprA [Clostridia bacterium]
MSACPVEYWVWLQTALGPGARTDEILAYFESPEGLYLAGSDEWRLSGLFTEKRIEALRRTSPSETGRILRECNAKGYSVITPDSVLYPKRLRQLPDMPLVIYGVGDCNVINDEVSIGIVGTRDASPYGIEIAQKLSFRLAQAGATVVSGGALGIDSEAHAGAMLAKGRTMAFLGCGLSCDYLRENASLRRAITRYGAVFSECQPFATPTRQSFPIRNRLISGASLGVVVIEAGVKSGSLITAKRAIEQGRDVFAVPGDIVRTSFDGANHLIQNGAKPVFSAADVLGEYMAEYGNLINMDIAQQPVSQVDYVEYRRKAKSERVQTATQTPAKSEESLPHRVTLDENVSTEARAVYEVLSEAPMHIDDIVRATGFRMNIVLSSLTELELNGVCELTSGKKYKLI